MEGEFPEPQGTLDSILEALTAKPTPALVQNFLLTYRAFSSPKQIIGWLQKRFSVEAPPGSSAQDEANFKSNVQMPIRLRVINFVRMWVTNYFYDFEDDPLALDQIKSFMQFISFSGLEKQAEPITAAIARKQKEALFPGASSDSPVSSPIRSPAASRTKRDPSASPVNVDPGDLAKQMTLLDSELFRAIKPKELLNKAWNDEKRKYENAPNVMKFIDHLNALSSWVTFEICGPSDKKAGVNAAKQFLRVLKRLIKLSNYAAAVAVNAGIQCASGVRLNEALADSSAATQKELDQIKQTLTSSNQYRALRTAQLAAPATAPVVPYIGPYLSELVFIEDGNATFVSNNQLVNFKKFSLIAKVISEVQQFQRQPYQAEANPDIRDYLLSLRSLSEEELNDVIANGAKPGMSILQSSEKMSPSLSQQNLTGDDNSSSRSDHTGSPAPTARDGQSPMVATLLADPVMRGLLKQTFVDELKPELARMVQEAVESAVQKHMTNPGSPSLPAGGSSSALAKSDANKKDKKDKR